MGMATYRIRRRCPAELFTMAGGAKSRSVGLQDQTYCWTPDDAI